MVRTVITREDPAGELKVLRQRVAELEEREAEYKKAEQVLVESHTRFKELAELLPLSVFEVDEKGKFIYFNKEAMRCWNIAPETTPKESMLDVFVPEDRDRIITNTACVLMGEDIGASEYTALRQDGTTFPVLIYAAPVVRENKIIGIRGVSMDITEHKRAEQSLQESEHKYRMLSDNVTDIVWTMNINTQKFDYISPSVERIRGYTPAEAMEIPLDKSMTQASYEYGVNVLIEELGRDNIPGTDPDRIRTVQFEEICKDGSTIPTEVRLKFLRDTKGLPTHVIGITRDITERVQVETELRLREEKLRSIFSTAPVGIGITTNKILVELNDRLCEMTGYAREELFEKSIDILYATNGDYTSARAKIYKEIAEKGTSSIETQWRQKDGELIDVLLNSAPLGLPPPIEGITFTALDITERKRIEKALRISEENYRNSIDSSPMGVVVFTGNEEILYANQTILDIYGYGSIEELRNTPIEERYTPESYAEYLPRREKFRSGEVTSLGYEISIRRKDGGVRYLQSFRKEIMWGGEKQFQLLYNDITERKKAEETLRQFDRKYRTLFEEAGDAIFTVDTETRCIVDANKEAERLLGRPREQIIGMDRNELHPADKADYYQEHFRNHIEVGRVLDFDAEVVRKDGTVVPVSISANTLPIDGKILMQGIFRDISKVKQKEDQIKQAAQEWRTTFDSITDMVCILDNNFRIVRVNRSYANMLKKEPHELLGKVCYELINRDCPHTDCPHQKTLQTGKPAMTEFLEPSLGVYVEVSTSPIFDENSDVKGSVHVMRDISERKQMEQQLMLTDRLASIGELASGVAHELNNPLTSVIGFSQLLIEGEIPDNIKDDLNLINSEAQRAASIVKNLLTFARKHAAVKQATKITNLIEDVLKLRAYEQKVNNIEVIKKYGSDLPEIMVDYFQIQQAFLNLIINAEFFMSEAHRRGTLTIGIEKVDHTVRISFADDGPGIPRENLNRIFDPFFTTKEVGKGTGLGLSICHGITTSHGGKIYAESEVGKGATFIVELPIIDR